MSNYDNYGVQDTDKQADIGKGFQNDLFEIGEMWLIFEQFYGAWSFRKAYDLWDCMPLILQITETQLLAKMFFDGKAVASTSFEVVKIGVPTASSWRP